MSEKDDEMKGRNLIIVAVFLFLIAMVLIAFINFAESLGETYRQFG